MSFLSPMAIAIAAAATIPPLVALYFLKLKRDVRLVPSTLLWKRAVEDLHVNSPFQRLRRSLLLLLQLLVLIAAAIALGKPMLQTTESHLDTVIILIDQSASMNVVEADGRSRLERAKEQAKRCVDNLGDDARAMVIAFCDRATVVSSFDTDRAALKRKIDSVEPTDSSSTLGEAMSLAEAYTQNIIIGGDEAGADKPPDSTAPPASVFLFTDGRVQDSEHVALQKFALDKISVTNVARRSDNVGIIAMDARRDYERPEILEVAATVENFGPEPVAVDAVLYIDGQNVDVQTVRLEAAFEKVEDDSARPPRPAENRMGIIAFDDIEFGGSGVVEVVLRIDDALSTDDRAWTVIEEPKSVRLLLVTAGNMFLETILSSLEIEMVLMTPAEYERAPDDALQDGQHSTFDVVMMDRHSTERLPRGNYMFWGGVPLIEGVAAGRVIEDEVIFNWDETHPLLRHVAVETLQVYEWLKLDLPPEAVSIVDGETSSVIALLARDASQYLISAFSLIVDDEEAGGPMVNTYWATTVDFVVFVQNSVQYLAGNAAAVGRRSIRPGDPVILPIPKRTRQVKIHRPDGVTESLSAAGYETLHYARTRRVGTYRAEPGLRGRDVFAVNLFNTVESRIEPAEALTLGAQSVEARAGTIEVNNPAWRYLLLAALVFLLVEWVIYNRRVFV